ncbi:type II toxin-antitoxin system RelE/ParE family toxin [Sphingomonas sp.]|uniref:type II toxin-antitoxin system RelE/ParE family toxin n=1 Tax=Sphingomonas sp. TaxID=28214 RepID=UPI003342AE5F
MDSADDDVRWLLARIDTLATSDHRARSAGYLYPGLFQTRVASHLIFVLIDDDGIDVVRLLHERMDAAAHLAEDLPPDR